MSGLRTSNLPLILLVMIESWVNARHDRGSLSAILVKTGGNTAVLDRGGTGWMMGLPSVPETWEPDRKRLAGVSERWVVSATTEARFLSRAGP